MAIVITLILLLTIFILFKQFDYAELLGKHQVFRVRVAPEKAEKQFRVEQIIVVAIEKDKRVFLNLTECGTTQNTTVLQNRLKEILKQRSNDVLFAVQNNPKAVVIKSPTTIKYGEVVKVIDAIKGAGAAPIILQIDGLPQ